MSNKRMSLSEEGKTILDTLTEVLEVDRPMGIKVALSKGLSIANGPVTEEYMSGKNKWTIPDVDVKLNFTLFARFLFTLLLKKCFSGFSCDDFPRFHLHG